MPPNTPSSRMDTIGIWMQAYDPSTTPPGATTVNTCRILVPFRHRLLKAKLACTDIDNVGAMSATLKQGDDGDAKAGTTVGTALTDTQLASTADVLSVFDITLAKADKVPQPADRIYHIALTGNSSGDGIEQPTLLILVEPIPRTAL